ncbi:hypothetical protein D3C81_451520 [compost metagenome]
MPIEIELPDGSVAEFPDGMPDAEIEAVIQRQFPSPAGGMPITDLPVVQAARPDFSDVGTAVTSTEDQVMGDGWKPGLLRDVAMGGRSVLQGAGSLLGAFGGDAINYAVTDPIRKAFHSPDVADVVAGRDGFVPTASYRDTGGWLADKLGLPKPQSSKERVYNDISEALTGTALTMGVGGLLNAGRSAAASPTVAGRVGDFLTAQPVLQSVATATGSGAAGATREAGGGTGAQLAAALAGGLVPGAATAVIPRAASGIVPAAASAAVRRVGRGSDPSVIEQTLKTFSDAGVQPSVGQATGNRFLQAAETMLGSVPGSAGRIDKFAQGQASQFGSRIDEIASGLAPGGQAIDPESAGLAIQRGITGPGGFKELSRNESNSLYRELDELIPQDTRVDVSNARTALADLNSMIEGAPSVSRFFQNARLEGIERGLISDTQGIDAILTQPGMREQVDAYRGFLQRQADTVAERNAQRNLLGLKNEEVVPSAADIDETVQSTLGNMVDDQLPYEALKKLRTLVGKEIDNSSLVSDVPRGKWRELYGALSRDMETAVQGTGNPKATQAFDAANKHHADYIQRLERIETVLNRNGGEDIYNAATRGLKEGATMLREVMRSLPVEDQKLVSSAFIRRMGRAVGSQQDADGSLFSMNTYLTNYANMSPQAKQVLFKNYGPEFAENMETIAKATSKIREGSQVFANPSGTARQGALIGQVAGTLSSAGAAAATGNTGVAMLALLGSAGTAVSANLLSRVFTHPKAVAWLARSTKAPAGDIVAQLNTLRRIGRNHEEPELLELADELQTQISEEEGKSGQ